MPMSKGAQTRDMIVREAVKAASVQGFAGLTIGNLAGQLKMSKSGLFAHFGSKEALQEAVLEAAVNRMMAAVWTPALQSPRGRPRIESLFRHWLEWMVRNPELPGGCPLIAAASEMDDKPGPLRDRLVAMQSEWMAMLARAAELGVREGHFHPDLDCQQFAFELNGIMLSLTFYLRLLHDASARSRTEAAFRALLDRAAKPA